MTNERRTARLHNKPVMGEADRFDWIERNMRQEAKTQSHVSRDVLDAAFVDAYIEATNAAFRPTNYGSFKCPMLGRDLSRMVEKGILRRSRVGIEGLAGMGFPRWVWSYRLRFN